MRWSDIPFSPPERTLRQFAGLWLLFFGGFAAVDGYSHGLTLRTTAIAGAAVAVGVLGLARPRAIRPVFVTWMVLAFPIGWVVFHVLFGLIYFGVFTPVGLFFRLSGRDALILRRPTARESYWLPKPAPSDVRQYFRQF